MVISPTLLVQVSWVGFWQNSFIYVTWLFDMCDMTYHMCGMTYSYVWRDSGEASNSSDRAIYLCLVRSLWLIDTCDMTHWYVWHDSFIRVTWLIHNTLQHIATHYKTLQDTATHSSTLRHTAPHCKTLQDTAIHCHASIKCDAGTQNPTAHYNPLQHAATHCNTLQHAATHCNTLQHTATHCNTLQHTATHCNTLQHRHQVWCRHSTRALSYSSLIVQLKKKK